jgi:hypothetical protein
MRLNALDCSEYPANSYAVYKGFYVSTTALENTTYAASDVRRYANAVALTYIVLPGSRSLTMPFALC